MPLLHRWGYCATLAVTVHSDVCVAPSGSIKASPQGGGFQVRSISGPTDLMSKVHDVFNNRSYFSTMGGSKGSIYSLCGVSWTALINHSKEGFSCLVLGFC